MPSSRHFGGTDCTEPRVLSRVKLDTESHSEGAARKDQRVQTSRELALIHFGRSLSSPRERRKTSTTVRFVLCRGSINWL